MAGAVTMLSSIGLVIAQEGARARYFAGMRLVGLLLIILLVLAIIYVAKRIVK